MAVIHPTAIVDSKAELAPSVIVGPYSIVEAGVKIGANCRIGPHCHLLGNTVLGKENIVHAGCVLGDEPQDLSYRGAPTSLVIGDGNRFREHVTIHRGTKEGTATEIGNHNYFMAHSHVAHNCRIHNHVIAVNSVLLGGYVEIEDRAFLGGGAVVHQFCRVGTLAILRGLSRISKDVPPFCMAVENNELVGLNVVGLRRAGFSLSQRTKLKEAYTILFRSNLNTSQALEQIESTSITLEVQHLIQFIRNSKRGISTSRHSKKEMETEGIEI